MNLYDEFSFFLRLLISVCMLKFHDYSKNEIYRNTHFSAEIQSIVFHHPLDIIILSREMYFQLLS